jgi:hypothetical protein
LYVGSLSERKYKPKMCIHLPYTLAAAPKVELLEPLVGDGARGGGERGGDAYPHAPVEGIRGCLMFNQPPLRLLAL